MLWLLIVILSQTATPIDEIRAGKSYVHVPLGVYTLTETLGISSGQTIVCEPGAVFEAAAGAFAELKEPESCLVTMIRADNVTIYNCAFKMLKSAYGTYEVPAPGYVPGEWRHALYISGATNVRLYNVTASLSGGDGLLISAYTPPGQKRIPSRRIMVENSTFADNHRQGISVTSCLDCVVEDCVFSGTKGTSPQAGIDIETEDGDAAVINIRRCRSEGNRGPAYMVGLFKATFKTPPSNIVFEDCTWSNVPADQPPFRLGGVLKPNGYLLDNIPTGTLIQFDTMIWRK